MDKGNNLFSKNSVKIKTVKPKIKKKFDPLKVINLRTLITRKEYPEPTYFVKPFLPEGLTILAGKAKIKKSFFSLDMAISIALGKKFLRKFYCTKSTVYYLPIEDNFRRVQLRSKTMLGKCGIIPKNLIIPIQLHKFPKLNQGGLQCLEKIVKEGPDVKVIIIDTYGRFIDKKNYGKQSFHQDYDLLSDLQSLAIKNHIAILLIHHSIKSIADDPFDEMQGTMGTQASPDSLMIIRNFKGAVQLCVKGRDFEEQTYILEFDKVRCKWMVEGNNYERGLSITAQKILQLFKDNPNKDFGLTDIHTRLKTKKSSQNTMNILKRLAGKNLIDNKNRNVYKLNAQTYAYLIEEAISDKK